MFDDKYFEFFNQLDEADAPPAPDPAAAGGAPAAPAGGAPAGGDAGGGAPPTDEPEKTPEEKMKEIEKSSQKSWIQLASILCGVIEKPFTPEQVEQITGKLPAGITISDFANYSANIKNQIPNQMEPDKTANMTAAAIKMFDFVKEVLGQTNPESTVPRAEDME